MLWEELSGRQNQNQSPLKLWFCAGHQREKPPRSGLRSSQTPTTLSAALAAGCRSDKGPLGCGWQVCLGSWWKQTGSRSHGQEAPAGSATHRWCPQALAQL